MTGCGVDGRGQLCRNASSAPATFEQPHPFIWSSSSAAAAAAAESAGLQCLTVVTPQDNWLWRHASRLRQPTHSTAWTRRTTGEKQRCFAYAGPAAWNRLPESIRRTSSLAAFKRQLKTFFISWNFLHCRWWVMTVLIGFGCIFYLALNSVMHPWSFSCSIRLIWCDMTEVHGFSSQQTDSNYLNWR